MEPKSFAVGLRIEQPQSMTMRIFMEKQKMNFWELQAIRLRINVQMAVAFILSACVLEDMW